MALNILTTAPTTEAPRPGQSGLGYIDQCWYGSASRWVCELSVATASITVTCYRYSAEMGGWIASVDGASTHATGLTEKRIEDGGLAAYRCLVRSSGSGTGTYVPKAGRS